MDFSWIDDGLVHMLNAISSQLDKDTVGLLTQTPAGKYPDAYKTATSISTQAVKPVAMTILAIVFTLEIIKVSKHVDETGDRGVRMIVSALIKIIIIYMAAMARGGLFRVFSGRRGATGAGCRPMRAFLTVEGYGSSVFDCGGRYWMFGIGVG